MDIKLYIYRFAPIRIVDGDTVVVMLDMGFHHYQQEDIRLLDEGTYEVRGMHVHSEGWWAATFASLWFQRDEQSFPEYILDFDEG